MSRGTLLHANPTASGRRKHENLSALDELFWAVSTPGSARYGMHKSLAEMDALVGPSAARVAAVGLLHGGLG